MYACVLVLCGGVYVVVLHRQQSFLSSSLRPHTLQMDAHRLQRSWRAFDSENSRYAIRYHIIGNIIGNSCYWIYDKSFCQSLSLSLYIYIYIWPVLFCMGHCVSRLMVMCVQSLNTSTSSRSRLVAAGCQALLILASVPLALVRGRWDFQNKLVCSSVLHDCPEDKFLYCGKTILYCGQILVLLKDDFVL